MSNRSLTDDLFYSMKHLLIAYYTANQTRDQIVLLSNFTSQISAIPHFAQVGIFTNIGLDKEHQECLETSIDSIAYYTAHQTGDLIILRK